MLATGSRVSGERLGSSRKTLVWTVVVFPESKLTYAVIAQEHALWSFPNVQEYYNLEVVRG